MHIPVRFAPRDQADLQTDAADTSHMLRRDPGDNLVYQGRPVRSADEKPETFGIGFPRYTCNG